MFPLAEDESISREDLFHLYPVHLLRNRRGPEEGPRCTCAQQVFGFIRPIAHGVTAEPDSAAAAIHMSRFKAITTGGMKKRALWPAVGTAASTRGDGGGVARAREEKQFSLFYSEKERNTASNYFGRAMKARQGGG